MDPETLVNQTDEERETFQLPLNSCLQPECSDWLLMNIL